MTGIPFLLVFILAVALMIVMISRWKIHPSSLGVVGHEVLDMGTGLR